MDKLQLLLVFGSILAAGIWISWLDHTKGWQFAAWFNGEVANPFSHQAKQIRQGGITDKDLIIAQLTERIQVLEKIVTEPAYELNQKLNRL